jgi:hypothetical protein
VIVTCAVPGQITSNEQNSKGGLRVCQSQKKLGAIFTPDHRRKEPQSERNGTGKKIALFSTAPRNVFEAHRGTPIAAPRPIRRPN